MKNTPLIGKYVKRGNSIRQIIGIYTDIPGGVILDKPIEGFKSWNLNELILLESEEMIDET